MFSAKNIVLLTEINGFFDASLLHNYMDVIISKEKYFKYWTASIVMILTFLVKIATSKRLLWKTC
ncbi:hypothetical protein HMPREF1348_00010 [Enterococcus faecium 505]|uniref:Uncharacterized protein n=1 Tax=Enterococcus faecium 505 TaxID=1134806 RepID=J7CYW6_ENTFC|nr:hypothetical protein HMPREF1348_00010 [Enterococcus faecium 505]